MLSEAKAKVTRFLDSTVELTSTRRWLHGRVAQLERELEDRCGDINRLNQEAAVRDARIEDLQKEIAGLTEGKARLQETIDEGRAAYDDVGGMATRIAVLLRERATGLEEVAGWVEKIR